MSVFFVPIRRIPLERDFGKWRKVVILEKEGQSISEQNVDIEAATDYSDCADKNQLKKTLFIFGLHFHKMKIIRNKKDYNTASKRLEKIFSSKPDTPEGNEAEILVILMEDYEKKHFPIEAPDSHGA